MGESKNKVTSWATEGVFQQLNFIYRGDSKYRGIERFWETNIDDDSTLKSKAQRFRDTVSNKHTLDLTPYS